MLKTGFKTKAIAEQTGIGTHSITRVNTTENYEEFCKKKEVRTKRAKESAKRTVTEKAEKAQASEQDLHDIARELTNIRTILVKMAVAWGVEF